MQEKQIDLDIIERLVRRNKPILCLDTCAILDLARDPRRENTSPEETKASLFLLQCAEQQELSSLITDTVHDEYQRNLANVYEKTDEGVREILRLNPTHDLHLNLKSLVSALASYKLDQQITLQSYAEVSREASLQWIASSFRLKELKSVRELAMMRVQNKQAPSHHSRDSKEDSIIFESYLWVARQCRERGLPQETKIVFVSSNTRDFATPGGGAHPHIAESLEKFNARYARNMAAARSELLL